MNQVAVKDPAPLDELMLAMDVVDTLRHKELMLARELDADDRDEQLLTRLRDVYKAQGIEVSDAVLAEGVRALRDERFVYRRTTAGVGRSLAYLYVTRARWGKWVGGGAGLAAVALLAFQLFVRGPELAALAELPVDLEGAYQGIVVTTSDAEVIDDAQALRDAGVRAVEQRDFDAARDAVTELRTLADSLQQTYELRVVSRPGEDSGVWRVPDVNRDSRNYYLIVEAIGPDGRALTLPVRSEEDGRTRNVDKWGLRVDEATFERVAADKGDDGIIQQAVVGTKRRGERTPQYAVATTGAAITEW